MGTADSDADSGFGQQGPEINRGSIMDQLNSGRLVKRWGHSGMRYLMDNNEGQQGPETNRGSIMDQLNNGRLVKRWGHPGMRNFMGNNRGLHKRLMGRDRMNHLVRFAKRVPQQQEQVMPPLDQPPLDDEWEPSEDKRKK